MKQLRTSPLIWLLIALLLLASPASATKGDPKAKAKSKKVQPKEQTVYVTATGTKYHSGGCRYLRSSSDPMPLSKAKAAGYSACSRCAPPQ